MLYCCFQLPSTNQGASNTDASTGSTHFTDMLKVNLKPLPPFPPDSPTPDYDKASLASEPSVNNSKKTIQHCNGSVKNGNADFVEMQSIESFKLTNPSVSKPKPPPIYFQPKLNTSTTTSTTRYRDIKQYSQGIKNITGLCVGIQSILMIIKNRLYVR